MYTEEIGILIDDIDLDDGDLEGQVKDCVSLIEALLAEVDHLQSYIIGHERGLDDYQEYVYTLSGVTIH